MKDRYVDGEALRTIRIKAQRYQNSLAAEVEVSNWHLCEIENDRAYCSDMLALRLAEALGCDVNDFTRPGVHPRLRSRKRSRKPARKPARKSAAPREAAA